MTDTDTCTKRNAQRSCVPDGGTVFLSQAPLHEGEVCQDAMSPSMLLVRECGSYFLSLIE